MEGEALYDGCLPCLFYLCFINRVISSDFLTGIKAEGPFRGRRGMRTVNDDLLVRKILAREEEAISKAKETYGKYCFSIAQNILRNEEDSEECVNEAFFAAWNSIPPHKPMNLKTYLGKLVREIAIDRFRKKHAQKRVPANELLPLEEIESLVGEYEVADSAEEAELSSLISGFLRTRNETERNVFIRRYWYYDSIEEICRRFGFGKSKVLMMLKRTRDRLAEALKEEGYLL